MEAFKENIFEWLFLVAILAILAYTAYVIKKEPESYKKNAKKQKLAHFNLHIPEWWGEIGGDQKNSLVYERTDTRYDWRATFIWVNFEDVGPGHEDLREVFVEMIQEKQIVFDPDTSIIMNPSDFQSNSAVQSGEVEMLRVEGTATQKETERIYYDAFLLRDFKNQGFLLAQSQSSVLNGLVEGPYFEEVMLNFEREQTSSKENINGN